MVPMDEDCNANPSEMFWLTRSGDITGGGKGRRGIKEFTSLDELEGCVADTKGKINTLNTTLIERKAHLLGICKQLEV